MLVVIFAVHIGNGLFMSNNGYEYALSLLAATLALAIQGAGRLSPDGLLMVHFAAAGAGQRTAA
ncbi:hypothetical protein GCM10007159_38790 [Modicisalibacter luteus]|nr:hypothetical protein GCM10007159_38790 [Halomonas lutea]